MLGLTNNCVPLGNCVRQLGGFLRYQIVKSLEAFAASEKQTEIINNCQNELNKTSQFIVVFAKINLPVVTRGEVRDHALHKGAFPPPPTTRGNTQNFSGTTPAGQWFPLKF